MIREQGHVMSRDLDDILDDRPLVRCLLHDVANAGVAFADPRLGYVEVQIDRETWDALAPFRREQR